MTSIQAAWIASSTDINRAGHGRFKAEHLALPLQLEIKSQAPYAITPAEIVKGGAKK